MLAPTSSSHSIVPDASMSSSSTNSPRHGDAHGQVGVIADPKPKIGIARQGALMQRFDEGGAIRAETAALILFEGGDLAARAPTGIAINDIDAAIKKLEKIKKSLTTSGEQLRHANNKTQNLTIKKLTKNNPTMQKDLMKLILTKIEFYG